MGIVMGVMDLHDHPVPTTKPSATPPPNHTPPPPNPLLLFQREGVDEKILESGRCKVQEIGGLILNMIRLHIYHITEVYRPNGPFPVVTLIP